MPAYISELQSYKKMQVIEIFGPEPVGGSSFWTEH